MRAHWRIIAAILAASAPALAAAAETTPTAIVVDATVQMGGMLGQHRKIDLVKTAVAAAVRRMGASGQVGLWAFGGHPGKKCEDTSELARLQVASEAASAVNSALADLTPKAGRAPVFAAVRAALKSLGDAQVKEGSVVLIAGTGDDCGGDVCVAAKSLQPSYPNVKLSVLGVGMSQPAADAYTCAAKAMGGAFTAVKTPADFDRALRQLIGAGQETPQGRSEAPAPPSKAAGAAQAAVPPGKAEKAAGQGRAEDREPREGKENKENKDNNESKAAPTQPQIEPNVILTAILTEGAPQLGAGVTWRITKILTTPTGQLRPAESPVWTGGGGAAKVKLSAGRYIAEARYGLAHAQIDFAVDEGTLEKTVALEAGAILAEALQTAGGQRASGALFTLYRRKPNGEREELGRSSVEPALFYVNAGEYMLEASTGPARRETQAVVQPGKTLGVNMSLELGALEIKTVAAGGRVNLAPVWHALYPANPAPGASQTPLLTLPGAAGRLELPAGAYRIVTAYGQARQETAVTVAAGQTVQQSIMLDAGEAKLHVAPPGHGVICAAYGAGQSRQGEPVGRAAGRDVSFILKAGDYDVECRKKGSQGVEKKAQIHIVAGETQTVDLAK